MVWTVSTSPENAAGSSSLVFSSLAPEFRLLCRAASCAGVEAMVEACAEVADWQAVWSGARRHRVASALYSALAPAAPGTVPVAIMERLQRHVIVDAVLCKHLARELAHLALSFEARGIRVLALKGIALSLTLYDTLGERGGGDIDLLVAPADLIHADALLRSEGYERQGARFLKRGTSPYLRRIKEITYRHPARRTVVELHQRLTENPHLLAWDHGDLWLRRDSVVVEGCHVATLPKSELPIYLAIHGASHCWERLRWLGDLADLLRAQADASHVLKEAEAMGLGRPVREAIGLCHHWLALPVEARLLPDPQDLTPFLRHVFAGRRWNISPRPGSLEWLRRASFWGRLYRLSLRRSPRYRLWEMTAILVWPPDWEVIRLPDALFWLYPLFRPVGWLLRRWR